MHSHRLSLRLGDYRRVLISALEALARPVALITITAPGDEWGWDDHRRASWNRSFSRRWKRLDSRAKGRCRRGGHRLRLVARVAQRQRRGLDHLHLVVVCETPADRAAIAAYVHELKQLGSEYAFGFVDDPFHLRRHKTTGKPYNMVYDESARAAYYLTRYLSESSQIVQLINAPDASLRPLWVAHELTQASGVNCRRLRRVRHAYWVVRAIKQGSRPTVPVWWSDLMERHRVISLLGPRALAAT